MNNPDLDIQNAAECKPILELMDAVDEYIPTPEEKQTNPS